MTKKIIEIRQKRQKTWGKVRQIFEKWVNIRQNFTLSTNCSKNGVCNCPPSPPYGDATGNLRLYEGVVCFIKSEFPLSVSPVSPSVTPVLSYCVCCCVFQCCLTVCVMWGIVCSGRGPSHNGYYLTDMKCFNNCLHKVHKSHTYKTLCNLLLLYCY